MPTNHDTTSNDEAPGRRTGGSIHNSKGRAVTHEQGTPAADNAAVGEWHTVAHTITVEDRTDDLRSAVIVISPRVTAPVSLTIEQATDLLKVLAAAINEAVSR